MQFSYPLIILIVAKELKNIKAKFNSNDLNISFNSRYLTDIASQIENESIIINLKDPGSPVLIRDFLDKNSFSCSNANENLIYFVK